MGDMLYQMKKNIKENSKVILGTIGDALMKIMILALFVLKTEMDLWSGLIMILFALEPFVRNYISLVFKGEVIKGDIELAELKEQLKSIQELSEYRVQLSAIKGEPVGVMRFNDEWLKANERINDLTKEVERWKSLLTEEKQDQNDSNDNETNDEGTSPE